MAEMFLPILFAVIVGLIYYITNLVDIKHTKYYPAVLSFSGGVSITYLILDLFPTFTEVALKINRFLYLSVLFGFIVHHLIEKEIYQHNKRHDLVKKLKEEEHIFSFVYHIILGILLVTFTQKSIIQGVLLFIPVATFVFVSTLPTKKHASKGTSMFLASGTLLGVLFAEFAWTQRPLWVEFSLVGLAIGVLLFTVVRHHIPFGRKGKIGFFSLGFLIYSALIITSWLV